MVMLTKTKSGDTSNHQGSTTPSRQQQLSPLNDSSNISDAGTNQSILPSPGNWDRTEDAEVGDEEEGRRNINKNNEGDEECGDGAGIELEWVTDSKCKTFWKRFKYPCIAAIVCLVTILIMVVVLSTKNKETGEVGNPMNGNPSSTNTSSGNYIDLEDGTTVFVDNRKISRI